MDMSDKKPNFNDRSKLRLMIKSSFTFDLFSRLKYALLYFGLFNIISIAATEMSYT